MPKVIRVHVGSDNDIASVLDGVQADQVPRVIERDGRDIAVVLSPAEYHRLSGTAELDVWASYDPARALAALRQAKGVLRGVDTEQLLKDIYEQRRQGGGRRT